MKPTTSTTLWRCEEAGKVELTAEQVEAIARAEWPGWFEPESAGPKVTQFTPEADRG